MALFSFLHEPDLYVLTVSYVLILEIAADARKLLDDVPFLPDAPTE